MRPIFFFSGRNRPFHEFDKILDQLDHPYVKFFDNDFRWFMDEKWKNEIQTALDTHGRPVLSIGSSMGGWGALYHQPQIQADLVIVFAPQGTTVASDVSRIGGQHSKIWAKDLETVNGTLLPPPDGKAIIYFGNHSNSGVGNSGHSQIISNLGYKITTVAVPNPEEHNVAGMLHRKGKLVSIIKTHLNDIKR